VTDLSKELGVAVKEPNIYAVALTFPTALSSSVGFGSTSKVALHLLFSRPFESNYSRSGTFSNAVVYERFFLLVKEWNGRR
jgi:hypothetical protein